MHYLIIDSGGSKTELAIFSYPSEIPLKTIRSAGFGLPSDSGEIIEELYNILCEIKKDFALSHIAVNLGGKNTESFSLTVKAVFPDVKIYIFRESDGTAALSLAEKHGCDIVLLLGTGSIAIGKNGNEKIVTGGWGMNIGDGGSGYDIGLSAIRHTLYSLDDTKELSLLAKEIAHLSAPIEKCADIGKIRDIRDSVRSDISYATRSEIAAYSKIVFKMCEKGDAAALKIMCEAGEKMADLAILSARKLGLEKISVAGCGGLINALPYFKDSFEKKVKDSFPDASFYYNPSGVFEGTKEFLLNEIKGE